MYKMYSGPTSQRHLLLKFPATSRLLPPYRNIFVVNPSSRTVHKTLYTPKHVLGVIRFWSVAAPLQCFFFYAVSHSPGENAQDLVKMLQLSWGWGATLAAVGEFESTFFCQLSVG